MNIQTASKYMEHGYRVRHPGWRTGAYLFAQGLSLKAACPDDYTGESIIVRDWEPILFELQSDAWVLILDGIKSDFGHVTYEGNK